MIEMVGAPGPAFGVAEGTTEQHRTTAPARLAVQVRMISTIKPPVNETGKKVSARCEEVRSIAGVPTIRPLSPGDARALLELRVANRAFLGPFDPERPPSFFTIEAQAAIARNPDGLRFAILDDSVIAGTIALSNVVLGPFRSANVGYWVSGDRNGRGLATRAVGEVAEHAFGELGLHRLEAATLVDNRASQRVLEKNRFDRIGLARDYLHINGRWRDHVLFQRTAD